MTVQPTIGLELASMDARHRVATIARHLEGFRIPVSPEKRMQDVVGQIVKSAGWGFTAEKRLGAAGTIDFYLDELRIGVECKVDGSPSAVWEQLIRYAARDELDGIVLVTRRQSHRPSDREICGKPVEVVLVISL